MNYPPLIIDISGLTLTEDEKNSLSKPSVAGAILFSRNYQDKTQLTNLTQQIKAINPNLLICVDHEGGRVQRFREGFTHLPAMAKLGEAYLQDKQHALELAHACGYVLAYELLEVGVDFSFAPVVDKDYGHNTVIGNRAFSDNPEIIIALANAVMSGMAQVGMANVIKHFPGHGYVDVDSHLELPIDNRMVIQIHQDMTIFRTLAPNATAIMPAHIIYKKCDLKPAGFSKFWLQKILRQKYQYQGVIISDDLSMQACVDFEPNIKKRLSLALDAGCDLVLICNQSEQVQQVLEDDYPTSSRVENLKPSAKLDKIIYQESITKITPYIISDTDNANDYEVKLLSAMRQTLIAVAKDTMTKPGLKHPLSTKTQGMITDCLEVIGQRKIEIEKSSGVYREMKPVYKDEQSVQSISIDSIKKN